jgi:hypothetical protein
MPYEEGKAKTTITVSLPEQSSNSESLRSKSTTAKTGPNRKMVEYEIATISGLQSGIHGIINHGKPEVLRPTKKGKSDEREDGGAKQRVFKFGASEKFEIRQPGSNVTLERPTSKRQNREKRDYCLEHWGPSGPSSSLCEKELVLHDCRQW